MVRLLLIVSVLNVDGLIAGARVPLAVNCHRAVDDAVAAPARRCRRVTAVFARTGDAVGDGRAVADQQRAAVMVVLPV